jgi:dipeptidyl aminopeptidase/acylaminoacyl peptidase
VFTAGRPMSDEQQAARWRRGGARSYDREWDQIHLFVVPVAGGEPRHVNRGPDTVVSYAWSPDGKRLALVVAPSAEPVEACCFHKLVVVSAADGSGARVLDQGAGPEPARGADQRADQGAEPTPFIIRGVAWSPDSRQLAYAVTSRGGLSHFDELRVRVADGSHATDVAAKLDLELTGLAWAGDARSLIASATVRTVTRLYRLPLDGRGVQEIPIGKRVLSGLEGDRAGRFLVTAASTPAVPAEPTVIDVEHGTAAPVASLNPQLADWTIARNEVVRWNNREGVALEGVLTVTGDARDGTPPPLVVLPHGGPDWASSEGFHAWAQFFAARGYSVFEPNYRGGLGYGRPFYEANRGRFGEIELADIESGVDALIASGKADRARLFYAGWSWGGYLSAWTLGHTDRYRAFMVGAGVVDVVVQYATSDINHGVTADWEYKGRPWHNPEAFEHPNPARALASARAPTLILHGEGDERVPFVNSQILYRALRDRGTPVTFWAYPREPHGFQEPAHSEHLLATWAAFFDEQLAAK